MPSHPVDTLSELVQMLSPSGTVDLRCRIAAPWTAAQQPAPVGHIPYHVVLRGEARVDSGARSVRLAAGDVVLFPRGAAHYVHFGGGAPDARAAARTRSGFNGLVTEVTLPGSRGRNADGEEGDALDLMCGTFVLGAPGSVLLRTLPEIVHIGTAGEADSDWLRGLLAMMRSETEAPRAGSRAIVGELSTALFTMLLRTIVGRGGVARSLLALMADARLAKAVAAVVGEPQRPWTVANLAALASMSRATLARRFGEAGGLSPLAFVTTLRMERAARLLETTGMSAAAVGEACGYASQAAFGRVFKQYFGVGPGAYRRAPAARDPAASA